MTNTTNFDRIRERASHQADAEIYTEYSKFIRRPVSMLWPEDVTILMDLAESAVAWYTAMQELEVAWDKAVLLKPPVDEEGNVIMDETITHLDDLEEAYEQRLGKLLSLLKILEEQNNG